MIYSVAVVVLAGLLQLCSAQQYCASFNPATASDVSGYVAMQITDGSASYGIYLDMTNFATTCDLSQGLNYHVHSYWFNTSTTSASNGFCGDTNTGGHYDPNFACSGASQNYSTACTDIGRIPSNNYVYSCTPALYQAGKYSMCEVGDISGKNGVLMPTTGSTTIFELTEFVDYLPPYAVNFDTLDTNSLQWSSVVFHCPVGGARLICAKLFDNDLSACSDAFSSFSVNSNDDNSNDDNGYTKHDLDVAVVVSVLVCSIVGFFIGILAARFCCPAKPSMSADTK